MLPEFKKILLKVLIAPAAFKGTFRPTQVACAIAQGVKQWGCASIRLLPLTDGGDGTIDALSAALTGKLHQVKTTGALGQPVLANWLELEHIAVVELASACGIAHLLPDNLNALASHTFGLGETIKDCVNAGHKEIVITLGGSASSDGGTGALSALGALFADKNGLALPLGAKALADLATVDLSALSSIKNNVKFKIACDVTNPLIGQTVVLLSLPHKKAPIKKRCF